MNPWRWVDPRVRDLRIADVQAYLLGHGWQLHPSPNPSTLLFQKSFGKKSKPFIQALPASEEFSDYPRHIAEFLTTLSEIEDRHPVEVLEDILRPAHEGQRNSGVRSDGTRPLVPGPEVDESPRRKRRSRPA